MSIRVSCQCGHEFRVKEKYAGSKGKCPSCGTTVRIPGDVPQEPVQEDQKQTPRHSSTERRHFIRGLAKTLLPKNVPESPVLEMAGVCLPAREPGQDYHDFLQLQDGSWAMLLATVNAHGLHAVESTLQLRAATRALSLGYSDPGAILSVLNRSFALDWPEDRSVMMLLIRLDPQTRSLSYASAAHPTPYLLDGQGKAKCNLESTDCSLALLPGTFFGTSTPIRLEPGDLLVAVSGAVAAAFPANSASNDAPAFLQTAAATRRLPARAIAETIAQSIRKDESAAADRTILVLKVH